MKTIIQEAQIFGPTNYFCHYINVENLFLEKCENYQKRSFRNRYNILTTNGVATLSIPLTKGKNNQQLITDVTISYDENWPEKHLQTIRSAYGKSAYFDYYFSDICNIFSKRQKFLFDLNVESLDWAIKKLKFQNEIKFTVEYLKPRSSSGMIDEEIVDLRTETKLDNHNFVKYTQVWEDKFEFIPNLSILDLLFCTGSEASYILKKMQNS